MAQPPKKLKTRLRQVDPLRAVMAYVTDGNLEELKSQLKVGQTKRHFVERVSAEKVPRDYSPLVVAVLNNNFEVFKYVIDNFRVNLEQETSAFIEGGQHPALGATPLWTASTLGRIDFVKLLVARGADIEHTTESKSSPLRGAAYDGHCKVCEFLIDRGADINKPNHVGQSPLTIAAAMERMPCVQLLISKGADITHKGHSGDTPLHVCVESGCLEVAKVLVAAGARNTPNEVGFSPAILACCYGFDKILEFLDETFHLQPLELYNCYCLLASRDFLQRRTEKAKNWLTKAVALKQQCPKIFEGLPLAAKVYNGLQEPETESDIQQIIQNEMRRYFLCAVFCERILGKIHPTTAFCIRISGDMVLRQPENDYKKCVTLWQRSLQFDKAPRVAYELQIVSDLLFFVRGFSIMADNGYVAPVHPLFQWGLKEIKFAHESKISETDIVCCLSRMLAVWIKVAECIKDEQKVREENALISKAALDLIASMEDIPCSFLLTCLQNLPGKRTGAHNHITSAQLPLHKVLALLLDHGCSVHCEDKDGNFPLHLAVKLKEYSALNCVKTLLEYGAHPDAVNYDGQTALDIAREKKGCEQLENDIISKMEVAYFQYSSLQCLASRSVVKNGIDYARFLPKKLVEYVSWHESVAS